MRFGKLAGYPVIVVTALLLAAIAGSPARADGGTLIIGMTAGDLPITTGNPDQGFEGYRFVGYNLYDSLVLWDLSSATKASDIIPGLATSWEIDPADHTRWLFHLRKDVKWHDGCPFVADDVVWNLGRLTDRTASQFDPAELAQTSSYLGNFASVQKIDDLTIAFKTKVPDSLFPYEISYVMMISPCRAKELKYNWADYMTHPSGTGPYRFDSTVAHQRMVMVPNPNYWNMERVPKQSRLILIPMPEAATRTAALLSGQVNWIEAPSPDAVPRLKSAGMQVITNSYPHNWTYQLNFTHGAFKDIRVRQAANYAINRADMSDLLGGMMLEGYSTVPPSTPYFGHPVLYKFDPKKAHELLEQAGCLPCNVTFAISTSGSGQMQPLPMNELVKSQMDAVGFNVKLDVMDWNALLALARGSGEKSPDIDGINITRQAQDPFNALIRHVWTKQWAPQGSNWGHYSNPDMDKLVEDVFAEFDPAKRLALLTKMNEMMNAQAVMIWVAHDVNPRALSPKVHGFIQAQSWFADLTPVTVAP